VNIKEKLQEFKKSCLEEALAVLPPEQRTRFCDIFGSVENALATEDKFNNAVRILESTLAMTKAKCAGCYNDDYNHGLGGATECWSYSGAKLISRKPVSIDDVPPWNRFQHTPVLMPNCYQQPRMIYVDPEREA
jgi:hypothetical protein